MNMDTTQNRTNNMRLIPLTQGQYALVDDEDYEDISQFKWFALWGPCPRSFYAARNVHRYSKKARKPGAVFTNRFRESLAKLAKGVS